MKLYVRKSKLNGEIAIPGSKSHTIRAVAIAAMAEGRSRILAPLVSEDSLAALSAARSLGAGVERASDDSEWTIQGVAGCPTPPSTTLDMGNSGTSLRIFTGMASLADSVVSFDGDSSLRSRPMSPLLEALKRLGVETTDSDGRCPLSVRGPIAGGTTAIDGASSQFLTSLLLALPLARGNSVVKVANLNEKPYVEMTLKWLADEGIQLEYPDDLSRFTIKGGQSYPPFEKRMPADFSTAAFPLAAAAATGGAVDIIGLDFDDYQGDKLVFDFVAEMGAGIARSSSSTRVAAAEPLRGGEFDLNATPDALPVLSVLGALSTGETRLLDCPQARIKETDRIACMTRELRKLGVEVEELEDGMVIQGGVADGDVELESYGDHRIAMALAVAGMAREGVTVINDAECAAVTYPAFVDDFRKLGADMEIR